jgi:hypothetical protein
MATPLITVLIDTYNYGQFIEEAVDSVLAQDFPPSQTGLPGEQVPASKSKFSLWMTGRRTIRPSGSRNMVTESAICARRMEGRRPRSITGWRRRAGKLSRSSTRAISGRRASCAGWRRSSKSTGAGMVYHNFSKCVAANSPPRRTGACGRRIKPRGFTGVSGFLPARRRTLLSYDLHPTGLGQGPT